MALTGLPDWHAPFFVGERRVFPAYERPGVFLLPPLRWESVGTGDDPAFRVDIFRQDLGPEGVEEFGLLTVRYTAAYDVSDLEIAGIVGLPDARFETMPPGNGFVQLTSAADIPLPDSVAAPQPLGGGGLATAATSIRLDGPTTELFVESLRRGLATIRGRVWVAVEGVAARMPGTLTVDFDAFRRQALASATTAAGDSETAVSVTDLRGRIAENPATFGLSTTVRLTGDNSAAFAEAALDRLLGRLAALRPAPEGRSGAWVVLEDVDGEATWDLAAPIGAPRFFELEADPLGPLRSTTIGEFEATVVHVHTAPAFMTGRHSVTFSPTIVLPQFGVAEQQVELVAAPRPPSRPHTVRERASLTNPSGTPSAGTVTFRLSPSEPLHYQWSVSTVLESTTGAFVVEGPAREAEGHWTPVRPDDTALRYVAIEASGALVAEAAVEVVSAAQVDGAPWTVRGVLDANRPAALLALPADAVDPTITATARAPTGAVAAMAPVTVSRLRLDPFSFPGSGPRSVEVILAEPQRHPQPIVVELAPAEALDEPRRHGRVTLSAQQFRARWGWYVTSPFPSAVCWRLPGATEWSAPSTESTVVIPAPLEDRPAAPTEPDAEQPTTEGT